MTALTTGVLGVNLSENSATASFAVGTHVFAADNSEWVYCQDSGSGVTANYWVGIDENFSAGALTAAMADDGFFVGIAPVAVTASYYFWACIKGSNVSGAIIGATPVDQALLYTSATAGVLGDAATGGSVIKGVTNTVSAGTGITVVEFILATNPHNH